MSKDDWWLLSPERIYPGILIKIFRTESLDPVVGNHRNFSLKPTAHMTLTFYYSSLCPRCRRARKHLRDLLGSGYAADCTEIDSLKQPFKTWRAGIRMIPALQFGEDVLSGLLLSKEQIGNFLHRHGFDLDQPAP